MISVVYIIFKGYLPGIIGKKEEEEEEENIQFCNEIKKTAIQESICMK
jgi:hypothetical protein